MRREVLFALVAVVAVLAAAVGFWVTAPSADVDLDPARVEASDVGAQPGELDRTADEGEAGDRAPQALPEGVDVVARGGGDGRVIGGEKGGLKRLKRTLSDLQAVPDEVVLDPEMTPAEQDQLLARPIQEKARILGRMTAEVTSLQNAEDKVKATRALLLLADGHDHMAGWLRERPAPLYLPETGLAEFEDALNQRADDQVMLSDGVRDQAVRQAEELPEDHPLRARLLDP